MKPKSWRARRSKFSVASSDLSTRTLQATAYDLGCILAHHGHNDEAFSLLREAIGHGLAATTDRAMATTSDLKSLHKDSRFAALVTYAQERAATEKPN